MRFSKWHGLANDYLLVERAEVGSRSSRRSSGVSATTTSASAPTAILEVLVRRGPARRDRDLEPRRLDGGALRKRHADRRPLARPRAAASRGASSPSGPREVVARMRDGLEVETDMGPVEVGPPERAGRERLRGRVHAGVGREPARRHPPRPGAHGAAAARPARREPPALPGAHERPARPRRLGARGDGRRLGARGGGDALLRDERRAPSRAPPSPTAGARARSPSTWPAGTCRSSSTPASTRA